MRGVTRRKERIRFDAAWRRVLACAWLLTALGAGLAGTTGAPAQTFRTVTLPLPQVPRDMHWHDLDGDGRRELLLVQPASVELLLPLAAKDPARVRSRIQADDRRGFLFDVADLDRDGRPELITLEGRGVYVHSVRDGVLVRPEKPALAIRRTHVPACALQVDVVRDLDGDGVKDLVYPTGDRFCLVPGDGHGAFVARRVQTLPSGIRIRLRAPAGVPDGELEVSFRIPNLMARDVDGDGRADLLAQLDRRLDIYRVGKGWTFERGPAWTLDLSRFEAHGTEVDDRGFRVDFGKVNLTQDDLDGDGVRDFLIASGRKVWIYYGGRGFQGFDRPDHILRVSQDIAAVFTGDVNDDGRPDLVLVKFELPGLARIVAALVVGIDLRLEALAYFNRGDRTIARKPDLQNQVCFSVPPIVSILSDLRQLRKRVKTARKRVHHLRVGDVTGDGLADVAIRDADGPEGNRLRIYASRGKGAVTGDLYDPDVINRILRDLLFDLKRNRWDLDRLLDYAGDLRYSLNRDQIAGQEPVAVLPLRPGEFRRSEFELVDVNGDGRCDVVVTYDRDGQRTIDLHLTEPVRKP